MKNKSFFRLIIETAMWASIIVGLLYVGGIAIGLATFRNENSVVNEAQWLIHLSRSMESVDVIVHSLKVIEDNPDIEGRVLFLAVSDVVGPGKPTPYHLVSGLHMLVGTGWLANGKELQPFDWVQISIRSEDAESYEVLIGFNDLVNLTKSKLTEEAYIQSWQISGEIPDSLAQSP